MIWKDQRYCSFLNINFCKNIVTPEMVKITLYLRELLAPIAESFVSYKNMMKKLPATLKSI